MENQLKNMYMDICIIESFYCAPETYKSTILQTKKKQRHTKFESWPFPLVGSGVAHNTSAFLPVR